MNAKKTLEIIREHEPPPPLRPEQAKFSREQMRLYFEMDAAVDNILDELPVKVRNQIISNILTRYGDDWLKS